MCAFHLMFFSGTVSVVSLWARSKLKPQALISLPMISPAVLALYSVRSIRAGRFRFYQAAIS